MNKRRWVSTEMTATESTALKEFLKGIEVRFETSGCYGMVHFEVYANAAEIECINDFIDTL